MKKSKVYSSILLILCLTIVILFIVMSSSIAKDEDSIDKVNLLAKGMSMEEVMEIFGEPYSDIGSGLYVYTYKVDSYGLLISFSNNKLLSAVLQNSDGTIHKQIIE